MGKINKVKRCFFDKTNKIEIPLTVLFKESTCRKNSLCQKYINEHPKDTEDTEKIMKGYQENLSIKILQFRKIENIP